MLNEKSLEELRNVYKELLKITGIVGNEPTSDYRDKRLIEHIHRYFKRINKNPIYKDRVF